MAYLMWPEFRWPYGTHPRTVIIAGIAGQDGSYLAEYLVAHGHEVHGIVRGDPDERIDRLDHVRRHLTLHRGDLQDERALVDLIRKVMPDRVFNLAGTSPGPDGAPGALFSAEANGVCAIRLLEAIRVADPRVRYFQASASAILAPPGESPQDEATPIRPRTALGCGKALAHHATVHYRETHGLYAVNGILFPHTSPRQSGRRLTRRITLTAACARLGDPAGATVRDFDRKLDLGFAGDYVEAMWYSLEASQPGDYAIGTGVAHTVRDLVRTAFDYVEMDWDDYVKAEPGAEDPEADDRVAASGRSSALLFWEPKVGFEQLIQAMIVSEFYRLEARRKDPRRYMESTTARTVRGPRPNWPLGRKRRLG